MRIEKDFKEFFELLNKNNAQYLIVGGFAFSYYAEPRYTKDIDIFVSIEDNNPQKIIKSIEEFGFTNIGLSCEDFMNENTVIQLGYPPIRIDILTSLTGIKFEAAFQNRKEGKYGNVKVYFISIEDLILNKIETGRDQDKIDVKYLEKIKSRH